ncbi:MAG: AgmX/PglI C-terminal domain-containing protein [Kofleriaceae bacterium]|nr:AgmX/PglI C-terminal domain-containing protein [Myxococcales bacterium]MCB9563836.1 AgmX/PglI C-terminal domain-containing protein [Kofleriaceae bacterium]
MQLSSSLAVILLASAAATVVPLAGCGGAADGARVAPPTVEPPPRDDDDDDGDDDAGDDGLELVSTRGKMDPADIQAGLAPHAAALEDCYASRVGRQKWMGGKVELRWELSKDGELTAVQLTSSDLGAWPVEKCLLDVARGVTFTKPRGGPVDFSIPLEFSARGNATWWDADRGEAVVSRRKPDLATCATEAGVADPGDVIVTVYVGTRGKVQSAGFASAAAPTPVTAGGPAASFDDAWAECAYGKVMAWTLSDPKGKVAKLAFVYNPGQGARRPDAADDGGYDDGDGEGW